MSLPKLTLVLGGASSGKSAFAERLIIATSLPKVYIATAQVWDDEMRIKVDRHRDMRGQGWRTVEEPMNMVAALSEVKEDEVALLDCATLWLSNHLLAENDLAQAQDVLLHALEVCPATVVVVSNEVGSGIVPETPLGRRFRDAQGQLNQKLAEKADSVVMVTAGLPFALKGPLP
ncbi:bifunctional adenosylcobinamide kinase/adenosylcobinamide-phosphate guanylyltransferase [Parasulfitobacter algicola]|uniref:Bifunctional adenosylcobalamin biosynthesis protein n=1 Tax=Parasulfitobacter algicola TaxID=2614809 RepID=A0ABX2IYB0_9RHOB|nr:bifunctional adenosylcobinamide kinase/adenosylcobinamide-phosphate guanylyltransferase [Sulfitobacter algicola]NSX56137.1 bifunctional adenosylcobinamide kinase/adenosylcobinamide-phosphate guanylyltransferase [Sulfitobacter algicola]